jgi:hypothetical protein
MAGLQPRPRALQAREQALRFRCKWLDLEAFLALAF